MNRNATLDIARVLAAFAIVLFHSGAPGGAFGYTALPFFLMVMVMLALPAATHHPFRRFAADRAARLLKPWVIWSAVYGACKLADVLVHHKAFGTEFSPSMVLTGPAIHLWFLPFAYLACVALAGVTHLFPQKARTADQGADNGAVQGQVLLLICLLVLTFESVALQQAPFWPVPFAQWAFALPSVFVGVALA